MASKSVLDSVDQFFHKENCFFFVQSAFWLLGAPPSFFVFPNSLFLCSNVLLLLLGGHKAISSFTLSVFSRYLAEDFKPAAIYSSFLVA